MQGNSKKRGVSQRYISNVHKELHDYDMKWTPAERYAIRQMLDVSCISLRSCNDARIKYYKLQTLGYVRANHLDNGRIKFALTERGRSILRARDHLERAA